jgi:2-polyprenyl-6-methoxyphenol hydroxylase-like FAD-dependent oxidoreductase
MHEYDVVIAGGGPVGMGLAIDLGQRGIKVAVLEKFTNPQPIPKGQNLTGRTMEIAASWGVAKKLRELRTTDRAKNTGGMVSWGSLLSGYRYEWLNRGLVAPYYDEANERLPQYRTEEALRSRVAELDTIDVFFDTEYCGYSETGGGVEVNARAREEGTPSKFRARYVVGCEGSRSTLRDDAGITMDIEDHEKRMALVVFKSEQLDEILGEHRNYSIFNNLNPDLKGYWQFLGRVDDKKEWFFHAPVLKDHDYSQAEIASLLAEVVGKPFDLELTYIGYWDLRFALANRYRSGRVFIAGDAAHSHPPYGGYGINSGFEDARNLGWKLEAVIKGWASESLLDSYDEERRTVFRSTIDDFIRKSIETDAEFLANFDPQRDHAAFVAELERRRQFSRVEVEQFSPHYSSSKLTVNGEGVTSAVGSHDYLGRPGRKLSRTKDMIDIGPITLAPGFYVVTDRDDVALPESLNADVKIIRSTTEAVTGRLVLVRPDGYVALNLETSDPSNVLKDYFTKIGYVA